MRGYVARAWRIGSVVITSITILAACEGGANLPDISRTTSIPTPSRTISIPSPSRTISIPTPSRTETPDASASEIPDSPSPSLAPTPSSPSQTASSAPPPSPTETSPIETETETETESPSLTTATSSTVPPTSETIAPGTTTTVPTEPTAGSSTSVWPWLLVALVVIGAIAFYVIRRRSLDQGTEGGAEPPDEHPEGPDAPPPT